MPSIAEMPITSPTAVSPSILKKRKREQWANGDGEDRSKPSSTQFTTDSHPLYNIELVDNTVSTYPPPQQRLFLKPYSMRTSRAHDSKRQRILLADSEPTNHNNHPLNDQTYANSSIPNTTIRRAYIPTTSDSPAALATTVSKPDLSPCHICHQKPKVRMDLDSYADCEGCGKRTCYICMRECLGLSLMEELSGGCQKGLESEAEEDCMTLSIHLLGDEDFGGPEMSEIVGRDTVTGREDCGTGSGWRDGSEPEYKHREMVCSRCCVERGADGDVRCLGCLRAEEVG